jgi:hypothetical protein
MTPEGYDVIWDEGFVRSLIRLRLTWRQWETLGGKKGIDDFLGQKPYEEEGTEEMPDTDARFCGTKDKAPDLPELLIAYRVDPLTHEVHVIGANPFWGEDALQRP